MTFAKILARRAVFLVLPFTLGLAGSALSGCGSDVAPEPEYSSPGPLKQSMDRASEVALKSNISQIQILMGQYKEAHDGQLPPTLDDLKKYGKDYPAEMWVNPVDKKPLLYDPQTGKISVQPYDRGMDSADSPKIPQVDVNSISP